MARRLIDLGSGGALLDLRSLGRPATKSLTPKQRHQIALTVRRVPEVMVKVSGGARTVAGVQAHLAYIGREGELGVEVDHGFHLVGKKFENKLVLDWDLDLLDHERQDERSITGKRRRPKLVHNLIFSMPPWTSERKVLAAVRTFAVNEFAFKHRYALILHTDQAHPHVHLVVKAESEQGERLNIRKATLRRWREQFASNLRDLGVAANATERAVRGEIRSPKKDAIYRAAARGVSTHEMQEVHALAKRSPDSVRRFARSKNTLEQTRAAVTTGWHAVARQLEEEGDYELAERTRFFVDGMPAPTTDQMQFARSFGARDRPRDRTELTR